MSSQKEKEKKGKKEKTLFAHSIFQMRKCIFVSLSKKEVNQQWICHMVSTEEEMGSKLTLCFSLGSSS